MHMAWTQTSPKRLGISRWDWIRFLEDPGLTAAQKQVWVILRQAHVQFGRVFYSMPTLAKKCGVTVRTVQRACRVLETKGWLVITRRWHPAGDPTSHLFEPVLALKSSPPLETPSPGAAAETLPMSPPSPIADHHPAGYPQPETPHDSADSAVSPRSDPGISASQNDKQHQASAPARHTWLEWGLSAPHRVVNWVQENNLVPPSRLHQWIQRYGLARTGQVVSWALSAPDNAVRSISAWIETALAQGWAGHNRWIQTWEASRQAQLSAQKTAQQMQQDKAYGDQVKKQHEKELAEWSQIQSQLPPHALEELTQAVYEHLQQTHGWNHTMTVRLARTDSVTFRCAALHLIRTGLWIMPEPAERVS